MALLDDALAFHVKTLNSAAGETITFKRGDDTVSLTAVVGQSQFDELSTTGEVHALSKTVDFLVKPASLVLSGSAVLPQRGDLIQRSDGSQYDVLPGVEGTAWQYSDGRKTFLRIHSVKRVAS